MQSLCVGAKARTGAREHEELVVRERDTGDVGASGVRGADEVRVVDEARATIPTLETAVCTAGEDEAAERAAATGAPEHRRGRQLAALARARLHALLELLVIRHVPNAHSSAQYR